MELKKCDVHSSFGIPIYICKVSNPPLPSVSPFFMLVCVASVTLPAHHSDIQLKLNLGAYLKGMSHEILFYILQLYCWHAEGYVGSTRN